MNENTPTSIIKRYGIEKIINQLKPYISLRRQQKIEQVLNNRLQSIQIALEMPADIQNAFAVIRSCEIFGVSKIHIIAAEKTSAGLRSISKGAMDWVDIHFYPNATEFLFEMKQQNCRLAGALPQTKNDLTSIPIDQPVCLLLGNENEGLSSQMIKACDWEYHIPMYGMTQSFNLSVAAAISLYETTRRRRTHLEKNGDLTEFNWKKLQAHYYLNSVNARLINALFRL